MNALIKHTTVTTSFIRKASIIRNLTRGLTGRRLVGAMVLVLCALGPLASTAIPAPAWFANLQLEITDVIPMAVTEEGLFADVRFEGSAGGRFIENGTAVGVDHVFFDLSGDGHLNVYLTITDVDGDQISANINGLATPLNPGQYLLQATLGTIINELDPYTGALHATTGKYAQMVGDTFEDVGFISGFSLFPPAGSVHAMWYLH